MAPPEKPLRKDAERNRRRVIEAAREVFAERGLSATLDDVADHAGVGVGTVYRRFADKEALIDAVLEERIGAMVGLAEEGLALDDPWDGLVHFLRGGMELQARDRGFKELLFSTSRGQGGIARMRERIAPLGQRLLLRAQEAGAVRADLSVTDVPLMQFMVGTVIDYTREEDPDLWRRFHTIVLDGLRPARDEPTPLPGPPLDFPALDRAMQAWHPPRR